MTNETKIKPEAIWFLQTFVTELVKFTDQPKSIHLKDTNYIETIGLSASSGLENTSRKKLGSPKNLNPEHYVNIITKIKNDIGGNFSRGSSKPGEIRVTNSCCPFGEGVKHTPELCRMTSSVFGGIAARNFGYAKVKLNKTIAKNDGVCDVSIYLDPKLAKSKKGTEYKYKCNTLSSKNPSASRTSKVNDYENMIWQDTHATENKTVSEGMVAQSKIMKKIQKQVETVGPTAATVLISGETGVGKEIIARSIHDHSERATESMITVNCGAIPENLIESILFGHEKGAFTDAYDVHQGYFERAENGTLFLDEINTLPLSAQARLLRVLQESEFERVGGESTILANVRVIAASNQNLGELLDSGKFRSDLYYRLNVIPIFIPPLRDRHEDIFPLVENFLDKIASKYDMPKKFISEKALTRITSHKWPGNARELENSLERAFIFAKGRIINDINFDNELMELSNKNSLKESFQEVVKNAAIDAEINFIKNALDKYNGNVSEVAKFMGISRRAVHMKLKNYGIDAKSYR